MRLKRRLDHWFDAFIRHPAWWWALILFWAVVTSASYVWRLHELEDQGFALASQRGRLIFQMVETTRLWVSQHGGVYAPVTATTPPNPYLDVPEKQIETPSGRALTLINPAYMTRQLGELINASSDLRIHLTSLQPVNPNNAPDAWEAEALRGFERVRQERIDIVGAGEAAVFRYMAPMEAKKPCLACHYDQGYRLGDIRGGLSVTFPAHYVLDIVADQKRYYQIVHLAAFGLISLLAWASLWVIRHHVLALEEARGELVENEKMASLGRLVAGFAHELNTPVGIAVGAVSQSQELVAELGQLLNQDEVTEDALRERLDLLDEVQRLAQSNLKRAAGLVVSFKRTAVDQSSDAERDYDMAELINDVRHGLQNTFKNTRIGFVIHCPEHLHLHGPAGMLEQVLVNLMENSRMHGFVDGTRAGTIRIDVEADQERVRLLYADDGVGMDQASLARIFEPFFTTRRGSGGSGLGLYVSYNLVTRGLSGSISCQSEPGAGTRFRIEFPVRLPMTGRHHEELPS